MLPGPTQWSRASFGLDELRRVRLGQPGCPDSRGPRARARARAETGRPAVHDDYRRTSTQGTARKRDQQVLDARAATSISS
jgi:hypothetical protein